jgi:mono/diheme cytochrome c family protein
MKKIAQFIAAGGLAIPLVIISWTTGGTQTAAPHALDGDAQATDQRAATPPSPPSPAPRDAGAIFESKCATCHGKDGRAKTLKAKFNKARNLTDAAWQAEVSDERIYNSIANGRGKKMPAFAKKLSRAEIEGLVGHVRSLKK